MENNAPPRRCARIIVSDGIDGKLARLDRRMSRAGLSLPSQFDFVTDLIVQARDINYGGHLGHDAAVSLLHEARRRFLAAGGLTEAVVDGPGLIMLELEVRYVAEAFWGDRICMELAVTGVGAARCEFRYRVGRAGQELLRARTLMGFFDYKTRRIARRPADFLQRLMASRGKRGDV